MKTKPYLVAEYYYPKSEHVEDVMNILVETSAMIKDQDGALKVKAGEQLDDGALAGMNWFVEGVVGKMPN